MQIAKVYVYADDKDNENTKDDDLENLIAKVSKERGKCKGCNRSDPTSDLDLEFRIRVNFRILCRPFCPYVTIEVTMVLDKLGPGAQLSTFSGWTIGPRTAGPWGQIYLKPTKMSQMLCRQSV